MYDGIIFDIDGTLWDARIVITDAWNITLKKLGYDIVLEYEELGKLFGKTMQEIFQILFPDMPESEKEILIKSLYETQYEHMAKFPPSLYEGTESTLTELSKKYKLYIVTNAQKGYIETLYKATGIKKYFTDAMCYGDTHAPKSVTIQRICERNNIKAPIYIGDTQGDADQCAIAKVPMIYAAYGLGNVEAPQTAINDIRELIEIFHC